jgi:hypothetical protein
MRGRDGGRGIGNGERGIGNGERLRAGGVLGVTVLVVVAV